MRQLRRPLLQEADLAVCFLLALRESGDITSKLIESELRRDYRKFRDSLVEFGGLEIFKEGNEPIGFIAGISAVPDAEEAICFLEPFSYISHLSAMAWHGLTDRLPKTLFVTRPSAALWRDLSVSRLKSELKDLYPLYRSAKLPLYHPVTVSRLRKRPINVWSSSRLDRAWNTAFKRIDGHGLRVATLGRCFLDMVREPELCGGIHHVMDVYANHGAVYLQQITNELDVHGTKIEKARAGYLLENAEPGLVENEVLSRWASGVARGGSRKLDPAADYAESYSQRWALSINV